MTAMPVIGVDHVQLAMPAAAEDAAVAFYSGVLGLRQVEKPEHLRARGGCWFEGGAARVHLGVDSDFRAARKAHPGLLVDDLGSVVSACSAAGVAVTRDQPLEGYDRVYVDDPFGNRLELLQRLG